MANNKLVGVCARAGMRADVRGQGEAGARPGRPADW